MRMSSITRLPAPERTRSEAASMPSSLRRRTVSVSKAISCSASSRRRESRAGSPPPPPQLLHPRELRRQVRDVLAERGQEVLGARDDVAAGRGLDAGHHRQEALGLGDDRRVAVGVASRRVSCRCPDEGCDREGEQAPARIAVRPSAACTVATPLLPDAIPAPPCVMLGSPRMRTGAPHPSRNGARPISFDGHGRAARFFAPAVRRPSASPHDPRPSPRLRPRRPTVAGFVWGRLPYDLIALLDAGRRRYGIVP